MAHSLMSDERGDGGKESFTRVEDGPGGLLDRGYRVAGEPEAIDGRTIDDLMRVQLEDAREATTDTDATEKDWLRLAEAANHLGHDAEAFEAAKEAVRIAPTSPLALLTLAQRHRKTQPARYVELVHRAAELEPKNPSVIANLAELDIAEGNYQSAAARLDDALARFDPDIIPEHILVERRAVVAAVLGQSEVLRRMFERYAHLGWNTARLQRYIDNLKPTEEPLGDLNRGLSRSSK